jgi:hypothetical protein
MAASVVNRSETTPRSLQPQTRRKAHVQDLARLRCVARHGRVQLLFGPRVVLGDVPFFGAVAVAALIGPGHRDLTPPVPACRETFTLGGGHDPALQARGFAQAGQVPHQPHEGDDRIDQALVARHQQWPGAGRRISRRRMDAPA